MTGKQNFCQQPAEAAAACGGRRAVNRNLGITQEGVQ
jgi:hypothetical protein